MPSKELLLIPGPTPVTDEIRAALAAETWSHTDPRFVEITKNCLEMTRQLLGCHDGEVFLVAGTGTLAMEMALVNTVAPGESILVLSQGYFGDRFEQIAKSFAIGVDVLRSEWGQRLDVAQVKEQLAQKQYKAVTVTHVDTSTGVEADLEALVPVVKEHGALFILDGVCATAAIEEDMSKAYQGNPAYRIDVVLSGSQKAIGVPPGLLLLGFSREALAAREAMDRVPAYYGDIKNWLPIMHNPAKYFATPAVNMVYAYEEGLKTVLAEGLGNRYRRHRATARAVRAALATYGMRALAAEAIAASTLSCVLYPEGVDDAAFRGALAKKGVVVAGALGELAGKAFRIGHMGNTTLGDFKRALTIMAEVLDDMGHQVDAEAAVQVLERVYQENLN
ncbi:MAG: alanine--glyoxylate aminotransferase family protein [Firmicutes bacterium]|nr:alanine--glyoxylate aminotransferase family protein [Bacillota bacterium]